MPYSEKELSEKTVRELKKIWHKLSGKDLPSSQYIKKAKLIEKIQNIQASATKSPVKRRYNEEEMEYDDKRSATISDKSDESASTESSGSSSSTSIPSSSTQSTNQKSNESASEVLVEENSDQNEPKEEEEQEREEEEEEEEEESKVTGTAGTSNIGLESALVEDVENVLEIEAREAEKTAEKLKQKSKKMTPAELKPEKDDREDISDQVSVEKDGPLGEGAEENEILEIIGEYDTSIRDTSIRDTSMQFDSGTASESVGRFVKSIVRPSTLIGAAESLNVGEEQDESHDVPPFVEIISGNTTGAASMMAPEELEEDECFDQEIKKERMSCGTIIWRIFIFLLIVAGLCGIAWNRLSIIDLENKFKK
ncbi:hypothetical protein ADUPG1_013547 [Aduncisulcus paluster]|uniref:Uncharacterized protein n=1 Tax=Aduncisulcus paluster TaxID=2918883 RepID=A0ABQ5K3B0_9EUKA|nr:hypothetical protein ADUPG1_013547 [Aduncisulcus paluster]